jgi:hypothetical protein
LQWSAKTTTQCACCYLLTACLPGLKGCRSTRKACDLENFTTQRRLSKLGKDWLISNFIFYFMRPILMENDCTPFSNLHELVLRWQRKQVLNSCRKWT